MILEALMKVALLNGKTYREEIYWHSVTLIISSVEFYTVPCSIRIIHLSTGECERTTGKCDKGLIDGRLSVDCDLA